MPQRHVALQAAENLFVENAGDEPHLAMAVDRDAVADRETRALLAAVLQRVQAEVCQPRDVFAGRVDSGDPARLVQNVTGRLPGFLVVGPRHAGLFAAG